MQNKENNNGIFDDVKFINDDYNINISDDIKIFIETDIDVFTEDNLFLNRDGKGSSVAVVHFYEKGTSENEKDLSHSIRAKVIIRGKGNSSKDAITYKVSYTDDDKVKLSYAIKPNGKNLQLGDKLFDVVGVAALVGKDCIIDSFFNGRNDNADYYPKTIKDIETVYNDLEVSEKKKLSKKVIKE